MCSSLSTVIRYHLVTQTHLLQDRVIFKCMLSQYMFALLVWFSCFPLAAELVGNHAEFPIEPALSCLRAPTCDNPSRSQSKTSLDPGARGAAAAAGNAFNFNDFQRLDDIYAWMSQQAQTAGEPGDAEVVVGGRSFEGREIRGLRIFRGEGKPRIFIEAGMHAREWITTSTAIWIMNNLLHGSNDETKRIATLYEWYIFPTVNPDGYEYSFYVNRDWRKTRSRGLVCDGVDGNRNWAFGWNPGNATTRHPCAWNFPGRSPFCEVETKSLSEYLRALLPHLVVYISLHSSKQMVLFPWGHTRLRATHHDELMEIGVKAANALECVHGTKFSVGPISTTIYMAPGNSVDWVHSIGVKYAYALELRNPKKPERYVCASAIIETGEETLQAILTILEEVVKRADHQFLPPNIKDKPRF